MKFEDYFESDDLLDALWDMHFDEMTPIQQQAIPLVLEGRDLLACAQTGTGKTAAYLLPVIDLICSGSYPEDRVNCVIMAPTRELAQQIDRQMQGFSYFMPITSLPIYGGTDGHTYEQQRKGLKMGADVVIATPGRLIAHLQMGSVDLSEVSFFILDEADRMLDMGFFDDIMQIIGRLPRSRQSLMFSATMPPKIKQLADQLLHDPVEIKLAVSKPADKIKQGAYIIYETQKEPLLSKILRSQEYKKVIIFSSSKQKVKDINRMLRKSGLKSAEMHSDLEQKSRDEVILKFKAGKTHIIVATDILARGIDIDDIELVINFDVPHEAEDYVHRVGRTARAQRTGEAITFVSEKDQHKFRNIEKLLEKEVEKLPVDSEFGDTPAYSSTRPQKNKKGGNHRHRRYSSRHRSGSHRSAGSSNRAKASTSSAESTK